MAFSQRISRDAYRIIENLVKAGMGISGAMIVVMMIVIMIEVILRQTPAVLIGFSGYAIVRLLFPLVSFMGLAYVWWLRTHIRVTSFLERFPPLVQNYLNLFSILAVFAIVVLITWLGIREVVFSYTVGQMDIDLPIPLFYFKACIPLGGFLLSLALLLDLIQYGNHFLRGRASILYKGFS